MNYIFVLIFVNLRLGVDWTDIGGLDTGRLERIGLEEGFIFGGLSIDDLGEEDGPVEVHHDQGNEREDKFRGGDDEVDSWG